MFDKLFRLCHTDTLKGSDERRLMMERVRLRDDHPFYPGETGTVEKVMWDYQVALIRTDDGREIASTVEFIREAK